MSMDPLAHDARPEGVWAAHGHGVEQAGADDPLRIPLAATSGVLGSLLIVGSERITSLATRVLPRAMTSGGRGTNYPSMEVALPEALRLTGLVLLVVALLVLVASSQLATALVAPMRNRLALIIGAVLFIAGFGTYLWFAHPPNMFPSNARIHWVDIWFSRSDDWFYPLIKLHRFVYDVPHLLQAVLGAFNTTLVYLIARRMFDGRGAAPLVAASFLGSSFMLLFAGTAEDVHLALAPLLLAFLLHLARRPIWWGCAAALAYLARPPFVLLVIAVVVVEVAFDLWARDRTAGGRSTIGAVLENRFVLRGGVTAGALIGLWNVGLIIAGVSWVTGDSVSGDSLGSAVPQAVDGFTLTRMSGAFVLHLIWIGGPVVIGANLVALSGLRSIPSAAARALAGGWVFTLLTLATLEAQPIYDFAYLNVRYLSYVWPFLLLGAWAALLHPTVRARRSVHVGLALLLLASPAAAYREDLRLRESVVDHPYSSLFAHRRDLRELAGDDPVVITTNNKATHNYIAYLLKRPSRGVLVDPDATRADGLVITEPVNAAQGDVVIDAGDVIVLRPR